MNNSKFSKSQSSIAWLLLLIFSWSVFQPCTVYAGGPTQPETNAFTPIGVSDMVDPFTGDFTYNIPLMDVEGYPINIAYNSGVTMDQEATWVGLGWNLNAGAITRSLRGLPDDFRGDEVTKVTSIKPTINIGIDFGLKPEIIGFAIPGTQGENSSGGTQSDSASVSISFNASLTYNNYTGYGTSISVGSSFGLAKMNGGGLTAGLSLSGSSENGASFAPSVSFSSNTAKNESTDISKTATIGTAYNSRAGLQAISYGLSATKNEYKMREVVNKNVHGDLESSKGSAISGSFDFGLNQYSPSPISSTWGAGIAVSANISGSVFGFDGQGNIGLNFSKTWIPDNWKTKTSHAYGYLFSEFGQTDTEALLDFNRDNDISFSKYSLHLPSTFQTYDLFSISAQGTGGSFRAFRNDVGFVFDPFSANYDIGVNAGFEIGFGNLTDLGADIQIPYTSTKNGIWSDRNYAKNVLPYKFTTNGDIVPSFQFIEASEASVAQDNLMTDQFYGDKLERLELGGSALFPKLNGALVQSSIKTINKNKRSQRELTNNQLYFLNRIEVATGLGVMPYNSSLYEPSKPHHIAEITQLGTDGRRYVFGLPAYNHFQEDVTFAVGNNMGNSGGIFPSNDYLGLVYYSNGNTLASVDNNKGIDRYYSSTTTPAYAHSYMLSAVLSDDYIDSDNTQGPSTGDLGSYVKFEYAEVENHKWRTPIEENSGYYNIGMRTDKTDDKASFVYGEKDLFYMYKIETKNYIAIFQTEARLDAHSASGRHGGLDAATGNAMQQLNSITLYSRRDYEVNGSSAVPIQQVKFEYDYSLCNNYSGNIYGGGKLTLKEIVFTYQNSKKMKYRSYKFNYSDHNPNYELKATDRWGTYKPNWNGVATNEGETSSPLANSDFPYTIQNKTLADIYAQSWSLTTIKLPSGGEINVEYESDDYGYVQHKKASQMFKIIGVYTSDSDYESGGLNGDAAIQSVSSNLKPNRKLLFNLVNPTDDISSYASKGEQLYFRALMVLNPAGADTKEKAEFISGYGIIKEISKVNIGGVLYGVIDLEPEKLRDAGPKVYSPIAKQAILFGRTQLSRTITDIIGNNGDVNENEQGLIDFANATIGAIASFKELATGPNRYIYDLDRGRDMVVNKSWMRLNCPTGKKLGGGSRVKRILIKDNWSAMGGGASSIYGQEFSYTLENSTKSSGVASYEPQLGGDENPWHTAYIVNNKKMLATDDKMYIEDPIMESQFPSPSIGYSRVEIRDLKRANVTHTATGKVVKEFYTARDFPTFVRATGVDPISKHSFLPLLPKYQYLTANEGFLIELNDMHGKAKKESVYAENKTEPISTVEYFYQSEIYSLNGVQNNRLTNHVQVINPDGTTSTKNIGVRYDAVADFRESETVSQTGKLKINSNSMLFGTFLAVIPVIYPGYDRTTNRFRSATFNKTVQKFGILARTTADQDGSKVETNNLAYDSRTGEVLVTQTTTDFNDKVYSLNYPAYWKYDVFGQASKNVLYSYKVGSFASNGFASIPSQFNFFTEGDEVSVTSGSGIKKGWIVERNQSGIKIIDKEGIPMSGTNATVKVIRSGYRNKQSTSMASMTSLSNPLLGIGTNQFSNVLNAGAVEFGDAWKTYCDCFSNGTYSTNPYVIGTKGNWRPVRSFTHLSGRTQTNYDGNTNIRKDGVFTSYAPFYKLGQGKWIKDEQNWTFVSEVTEFSPNGMTLETRDALGRYSSSLFEFNNTLTTAVAANAKAQQIATGSFEDAGNENCLDQGYFSKAKIGDDDVAVIPSSAIETTHVHTGRKSIKVEAGSPVVFENVISTCLYETGCDLEIILVTNKEPEYFVTGGTPPYQFSSEAFGNGYMDAQLLPSNKISYQVDYQGEYLIITITDSKGCKATVQIVGQESPE
ncbi:hypothetical protein [Fluviicola taffensis]|uniref:YD repeat protein n=1 Tax=Fluviicola taffensis (strain DSM 16823 / NCIMB 13979 / RW262) TaxID=755732 RepID=F2IEX7_FLUTR|nr:hypothetical protein [Fluviicola taffensis]AEA42442.1 hypothetical protein Fluta_0436 [Fluviicola taffensis DSM 16823]